QLVNRLAGRLRIQGDKHRLDMLMGDIGDDRRKIGRMHFGQLVLGHGQGQSGKVHLQRLHELPADLLPGDLFLENGGYLFAELLETKTAQQTAQADIDGQNAEIFLVLAELDVVHPYDLGSVHIDDLLVQDIPLYQDLVLRLKITVEIRCRSFHGDDKAIEQGDGAPGDAHGPLFLSDDEVRNLRETLARHHDDIAQLADPAAMLVDHHLLQHPAEIDFIELFGHDVETSRRFRSMVTAKAAASNSPLPNNCFCLQIRLLILNERIVKNNPCRILFTPYCQRKTFGQVRWRLTGDKRGVVKQAYTMTVQAGCSLRKRRKNKKGHGEPWPKQAIPVPLSWIFGSAQRRSKDQLLWVKP